MWATGMIFVHRGRRGAAMGSLVEAAARVRDGANVLVFPEGTRSRDGNVQAFKKGAFVLATQAGVPIVPVAIEGSGRCFPPVGFRIRPGVIRVKLGNPIPTRGPGTDDVEELVRRSRQTIIDMTTPPGDAWPGWPARRFLTAAPRMRTMLKPLVPLTPRPVVFVLFAATLVGVALLPVGPWRSPRRGSSRSRWRAWPAAASTGSRCSKVNGPSWRTCLACWSGSRWSPTTSSTLMFPSACRGCFRAARWAASSCWR